LRRQFRALNPVDPEQAEVVPLFASARDEPASLNEAERNRPDGTLCGSVLGMDILRCSPIA
jgi:hypothetical protein